MVSEDYIEILEHGLKKSARDLGMGRNRWIFQQDNDPKVTAFAQFHIITVFRSRI